MLVRDSAFDHYIKYSEYIKYTKSHSVLLLSQTSTQYWVSKFICEIEMLVAYSIDTV